MRVDGTNTSVPSILCPSHPVTIWRPLLCASSSYVMMEFDHDGDEGLWLLSELVETRQLAA